LKRFDAQEALLSERRSPRERLPHDIRSAGFLT